MGHYTLPHFGVGIIYNQTGVLPVCALVMQVAVIIRILLWIGMPLPTHQPYARRGRTRGTSHCQEL